MTYEKPIIIDLGSTQSETGFGSTCSDGSGNMGFCTNGLNPKTNCGNGTGVP
jgi:hypothetical protein